MDFSGMVEQQVQSEVEKDMVGLNLFGTRQDQSKPLDKKRKAVESLIDQLVQVDSIQDISSGAILDFENTMSTFLKFDAVDEKKTSVKDSGVHSLILSHYEQSLSQIEESSLTLQQKEILD